jgi:hypothetical protein
LRGLAVHQGATINGNLSCDSFRLNQVPVAETITPDKTITIKIGGANYKIAVKQA